MTLALPTLGDLTAVLASTLGRTGITSIEGKVILS